VARERRGAGEYSDRIEAAAWGVAPHLRSLHRDPHQTTGFDQVISHAGRGGPLSRHPAAIPPERFVDRRREVRPEPTPGTGQYPLATRSLELYETAWVLSQLALVQPAPPRRRADPGAEAPAPGCDVDPTPGEPADLAVAALAFQVLHWAGETPIPPACCASSRPEHFRATSAPQRAAGLGDGARHLLEALRSAPRSPAATAAFARSSGSWPAPRPPITSGRTRATPRPTWRRPDAGRAGARS
jgi:hypothetical protein